MRILKKFSILLLTITMVVGSIFVGNMTNSYASTSYKNSVTNKNALTTSARSGNYIYCSSGCALYKVNVKTKKKTILYKGKYAWASIRNVSVYKDYVYFISEKGGIDISTPYIYRIKTNGKNLQCLGLGENPIPYGNKVYYLGGIRKDDYESKTNGIYKMNLNGSNKTCIDESEYILNFTIYNSSIYYIFSYCSDTSFLCKTNLNGNNYKELLYYSEDNYDILNIGGFYNGYIYLYTNKGFYKLNLSNNKLTKIKNYTGNILGVEKGYLYYLKWGSSKNYIYKLNLSNNKKTLIASGKNASSYLVSSDYMIYSYLNKNMNYLYYYLMTTNGKNKIYLGKSFVQ